MASRPEEIAPPEIFYNETEARKYTTSSRMIEIQSKLADRALELLNLPDGASCLLLDIGCGSGLSGESLSESGHHWVGMDISADMLDVAVQREVGGDLLLGDMGQGLGTRTGVFDGAISISAIQWLCNADKSTHNPRDRLRRFFSSLYRSLARGARAALQFYPANPEQSELICQAAMKVGFSGGLVVDYPHSTRAKKFYLCLMAGPPSVNSQIAKARITEDESESEEEEGEEGEEGTVGFASRERMGKRRKILKAKKGVKGRTWLLKKKEQRRAKGYVHVPLDTKYTGRKRKTRF